MRKNKQIIELSQWCCLYTIFKNQKYNLQPGAMSINVRPAPGTASAEVDSDWIPLENEPQNIWQTYFILLSMPNNMSSHIFQTD